MIKNCYIVILLAFFAGPALACVWWAAINYLGLLLSDKHPITSWQSRAVSTIRLSVVQESNVSVKLFLINSLNIVWVSASAI